MRGMRRRRSSELASRGKKTLTFARNNTATYVLSFRGEKKTKIVCLFEAIRWLVLRPWDKSNAKGIWK